MAVPKYKQFSTPEWLEKIEQWARRGLYDQDIADNLGISRTTLFQKNFKNVYDAIQKGREASILKVENALFKKAFGYQYDEITEEYDKKTGTMVVTKRVTKDVPPDLGAQVFILKNRMPKYWKDKIISNTDEESIAKAENVLVKIKEVAEDADRTE